MNINVYDWKNEIKPVSIPAESIDDIVEIHVVVISGDETGLILTKDGTCTDFDASNDRTHNYFDAEYTLTSPEDISEWIKRGEESTSGRTISYERIPN